MVRIIQAIKLLYLPMSWYICFSGLQYALACVYMPWLVSTEPASAECSLFLLSSHRSSHAGCHPVPAPLCAPAPSAGGKGRSSRAAGRRACFPHVCGKGYDFAVFLDCLVAFLTTAHIHVFSLPSHPYIRDIYKIMSLLFLFRVISPTAPPCRPRRKETRHKVHLTRDVKKG